MIVCDVCGSPETGLLVSSEDMRKAVFKKGFNPFALGLVPFCFDSSDIAFERWKNTVVAQDTSDWNICPRCMSILKLSLEGKPTPSGIMKSKVAWKVIDVSRHRLIGEKVAKEVEKRYKSESAVTADTSPITEMAKAKTIAIADKAPQKQVSCSSCGKAMPNSLEYCSNCGKKLEKAAPKESISTEANRSDERQIFCSGCKKKISSSLEYCSNCGKKLVEAEPEGHETSKSDRTFEDQVCCSVCGKAMPNSLEYCANCGKKLIKNASKEDVSSKERREDEGHVLCGGCGKTVPSSLEYCTNCGKKIAIAKPQEGNEIVGGACSHAVGESAEKEKSEKEVHADENMGKSPELETDMVGNGEGKATQRITCASCRKDFAWSKAYWQQETRGSFLHNPPGHGNFRPRAFCPNCGFLVAEWDIDRYKDRNRWKWYGENAQVNQGRELPPGPLGMWGQDIPSGAQVTVREDRIDIRLLKSFPPVEAPKDVKEVETKIETPLPKQILANAKRELDNSFRSRLKGFDRAKEAFEALKTYVEGEGKSDAKAIALLGLIEYYSGKRDEAREMFNRSLAFDASCALSHLGLGILDYWDANFGVSHPNAAKSGLKRLSDAITLDSSLVDAYVWKARIQKQNLKDSNGAWNTLQEAISNLGEDKIKEDAQGHYLFSELGQLCVYDYKGTLDDALRYFETALAVNPNQYEAPMYLMYMYKTLGRSADATRAQLAFERADQGIGLSREAIDSIRRFVASVRGSFIGQKYEVLGEVGHGGFGVVYLVYSHETKEVYAFKTFKDEYLVKAEARELFRKEANVWIELERHPYLVRAYFVDELEGRLYIAMEYVAPDEMGLNSLEGYLKQQPPDLAQSLRWAIQFCYGMEFAYSKGVRCHRDIKPANIMIGADKTIKITDFGLADFLGSAMESKSCGTPTHMSPEQFINSGECDERSDVYAFGIVLYQMATSGRLPFLIPMPGDKSSEEQARFWNGMCRLHIQAEVPQLSSPLFSIIKRCLEKKPERRYQTFGELRADLELLLKRQTGETIKLPNAAEFGAREWNNKGTSLEKVGRYEEAIKCYEKALEINPQQTETWFNKGNSLGRLGRFDEATKCHDKALEINPQHPTGWNNKGVSLQDLGRFDEAIKCYEKALKINPRNADAWSNKGVSLTDLGRFDEAIKCCEKALEINPKKVNAWVNKGNSLRRLGRFDEAIKCHDKALEIDPQNAGAWNNKGVSLVKLGRFDEAIACYEKALEINPQQADAWYNMGNSFLKLGRFDKAIKCYEKTIEINPRYSAALVNKGVAERLLGLRRDGAKLADSY
jgi:tetratricopeptide (TPR) repeat protein/predicted amidophosphoribosyltransferase